MLLTDLDHEWFDSEDRCWRLFNDDEGGLSLSVEGIGGEELTDGLAIRELSLEVHRLAVEKVLDEAVALAWKLRYQGGGSVSVKDLARLAKRMTIDEYEKEVGKGDLGFNSDSLRAVAASLMGIVRFIERLTDEIAAEGVLSADEQMKTLRRDGVTALVYQTFRLMIELHGGTGGAHEFCRRSLSKKRRGKYDVEWRSP